MANWWDVLNPVWDITQLVQDGGGALTSFLAGMGGNIATGLESGLSAILGDLFDVIIGPAEVLIGLLIIMLVFGWAFRHQAITLASFALGSGGLAKGVTL